ncbi:MAG TPA: polyprenyl synthetase family protein [Chloroflexota bacterium]|jgi:geranylgeranyl pyrophosphate synthase|nr:polyprenyl synthetase family protein [Chloroflexota bacterium]
MSVSELLERDLQTELAGVERLIGAISDEVDVPLLGQLLRHILQAKGKRLRPRLAFMAARFGTYPVERLTLLGSAVELLHTASLIHDDLVDNADTRRGIATLHRIASPKASVLVGDYLFAKSAALATATNSLEVMALFARTLMAICDGELREMSNADLDDRTLEQYYRRLEGKTASLFVAATEGGAILSQIGPAGEQALREYGRNLGMAFQIADDILDFVGTEDELGKPVGGDLRQGTLTLPALWALERMPDGAILRRVLESSERTDEQVAAAVKYVAESPAIAFAQAEAEAFAGKAREALASLPEGEAKRALELMADYAVRRRR